MMVVMMMIMAKMVVIIDRIVHPTSRRGREAAPSP